MIGNIVAGTFSSGAPPAPPNSYESIATSTVGSGGAASITFTESGSAWSSYKHLQLRLLIKDNTSDSNGTYGLLRFNSDSGTTYDMHQLFGNGSSASASAFNNVNQIYLQRLAIGTNVFSGFVIDILDFASTTKNKTVRMLGGFDNNGAGRIVLGSGLWRNTNAITSIYIAGEGTLQQYTHAALYGIKD
jgi:hypothetical protein